MGEALSRWLIFGGCATVAALCTVCTYLITPKRTYYPLLRVIFLVTAFIYGASAASQFYHATPTPGLRLWVIGAAVLMLAISTAFIVRRNAFPQWVAMDWKGALGAESPDAAELDHCVLTTLSLINHGAASPELIGQLRNALSNWERHERWKGPEGLGRQYREHRARREARQSATAAKAVLTTEGREGKERNQ